MGHNVPEVPGSQMRGLSLFSSGGRDRMELASPDTPQHTPGVSFSTSERSRVLGKLDFDYHVPFLRFGSL